jgi:flavin reductase (DIM6/NTAB) family NADH-FMN oxidoreductase RutF
MTRSDNLEEVSSRTRLALRRLAGSVALISARWLNRRYAMIATAVDGLSLDPPSLLVCVNKAASLAEPLRCGAAFAVNLLGSNHREISALCASAQGEGRFAAGEWAEAPCGTPILRDAQATFLCTPDVTTPYGTHNIVIGRVRGVEINGSIDPLIYVDGNYHRTFMSE